MPESAITEIIKALQELEAEAERLSSPSPEEVAGLMKLAEKLADEIRAKAEPLASSLECEVEEELSKAIEQLKARLAAEEEARLREADEAAQQNFEKAVELVLQLIKGAAA